MLRLLANISPVAVLLLGAVPAATVGWFAHGVKFALVDSPAIVREATSRAEDACAIRVQAAADRAEDAERARQKAAGQEALRVYREALARSELAIELQSRQMSEEIAHYEAQLEAQGRSCPLSREDLDFVFGPGGAGR